MIRLFPIVLTLLPVFAWSAAASISAPVKCPASVFYDTGAGCPVRQTSIGHNTMTSTGGNYTYSAEVAGATLHACVTASELPPTCPSEAVCAKLGTVYDGIKACTNGEKFTQTTAAGGNTLALTGLASSATLYVHTTIESAALGFKFVSDASKETVVTLPSGVGEAVAGRFINQVSGDDFANGLSPATAWKNISAIKSASLVAGEDVWLHEGHTWTGQDVDLNWDGISLANPATLGCYDGTATKCVPGVHTRPHIKGSMLDSDVTAKTVDFTDFSDSPLSGVNDALIKGTRDFLLADFIEASHTKGRIFSFKGLDNTSTPVTAGTLTGVRVRNVVGHTSGFNPFIVENKVYNFALTDFLFYDNDSCEGQQVTGGNPIYLPNLSACGTGGNPGGTAAVRNNGSDANIIFARGATHSLFGECFNVLSSQGVILQDLVAGGCYSGSYYFDAANNAVVERSIAYSTNSDCGVYPCSGRLAGGGTNNIENSAVTGIDMDGVRRNMLMVGVDRCNNVALGSTAAGANRRIRLYLLGITCIAPTSDDGVLNTFSSSDMTAATDVFKFINNLSWDQESGTDYADYPTGANFTYKCNVWSEGVPNDPDVDDPSCDTNTRPSLASTYSAITAKVSYANHPTFADVTPTAQIAGDTAIINEANVIDWTPIPDIVAEMDMTGCVKNVTDWKKGLPDDALKRCRVSGTKGAVEYIN